MRPDEDCPICAGAGLDGHWYAYLLGMYLGDGCLSEHARRVFFLRVALDKRYPGIIEECAQAIREMRRRKKMPVWIVNGTGCVEVTAAWKHWTCLFPQHGSGMKHKRKIELAPWQKEIVKVHPGRLLRGLIHSDGWRGVNRVNGSEYPRYIFTNHSDDIRATFCDACDDYGIRWRRMTWRDISIARKADVAKLDLVVGLKR